MVKKAERDLFKKFIQEMNGIFESEDFANYIEGRNQKNLLDDLFDLERQFKVTLQSSPEGRAVYSLFMDYILNEKRNILSTRIFFREKQETFSKKIAPAFHKVKPHLLYKFKINYQFAKWVIERYKGPRSKKLRLLYKKIIELRKALCEQNLPLAINRAKIFWSKSPSFHIEYMDLVQSSAEGLMSAIDKFVPPYRTVFRSVAISRMTLNMTEDNSATIVRLSPRERRILYRVNKAKADKKIKTETEVLDFVRESFGNVTLGNLSKIVLAASHSYKVDEGEFMASLSEDINAEKLTEKQELVEKIKTFFEGLPQVERKILHLKYGLFEG